MNYKGDLVDILVKSKAGEENVSKPLLLFCQGSLPQPLIKYNDRGALAVFTFRPDSLTDNFHLVIVSKPGVPVVAELKSLRNDLAVRDSTGNFPPFYLFHNYLDYYVRRNIEVIKFLQKQRWISSKRLVVVGHSEGSTVAAKMALVYPKISHLIYSSGNPLGRILSVIQQERKRETAETSNVEYQFEYWKKVVSDSTNLHSFGDSHKTTYSFSIPPIQYLQQLKIPVLVTYGTKDYSAPFNDFLRVEAIRRRLDNFTFKAYIGTEHNYFSVKESGEINYDVFNWDNVAEFWRNWLLKN